MPMAACAIYKLIDPYRRSRVKDQKMRLTINPNHYLRAMIRTEHQDYTYQSRESGKSHGTAGPYLRAQARAP